MASYCEENRKLKFISECFLKSTEVANNEAHNYLNALEIHMLSMGPMQKGLLYNTKPQNIESDILPKLKKSLYVSLVHFYPLAGQLATRNLDDENKCCFYVDCNKGPGVRLIHASVEYTVSDICSSIDVHPIVDSFFDLGERSVNYDGHTRSLLSVQVTELVDGAFIGFTMNHCIADGTSLWHFISSLSEIFGQLNDDDDNNKILVSKKPIFTTLFPEYGYDKIYKLPPLEPEKDLFRYDPGTVRVRLFHFSSRSISMLKAQANEELGTDNNISSFQALCGLTWRSITRARNLQSDLDVDCTVIMNARTRLNPPLPSEYFKSFLWGARTKLKVSDLLLGSNGLGRGALLINQSIKMQDEKIIRELAKLAEANPRYAQPGPRTLNYQPHRLFIGGSTKFEMYGPEFGLGKAIAVLAGHANKEDGKVTANPGRNGDGSVDLEICLKPETMNALQLDDEFMSFASKTYY